MEITGIVHNGVVVPDDASSLVEGTKVRIVSGDAEPKSFGERYAEFAGVMTDAPEDLAAQHEHYRLGTPKR